MRVQFDATLDDFVDLAQRSSKWEKPIYSWWNGELYAVALIVGGSIYIFSPVQKLALSLIGFGLVFHFYPNVQRYQMNKRLHRIYQEQLGINSPVKIEVELSEKGVWTKQLDTEILRDWEGVTGIEETEDSIDFFFIRGGLGLVVRKRAFASEEEKERFLSLANFYLQASHSSTE